MGDLKYTDTSQYLSTNVKDLYLRLVLESFTFVALFPFIPL